MARARLARARKALRSALAFQYAFLVIVIRHLRFFTEPVPHFISLLGEVDGFVQFFVPTVYLSGVVLVAAGLYLLGRRLTNPSLRYISLASDYFPLFLIIGIATTGILMRYFYRVDIQAVKQLALGLVTLHPTVPAGIGAIFYVHLFLVCALLAYFPFSKLMHAPGVFMSPSRNMTSNNRMVLHFNPWNYPVKFHTYMVGLLAVTQAARVLRPAAGLFRAAAARAQSVTTAMWRLPAPAWSWPCPTCRRLRSSTRTWWPSR